MLHLLGDVCLVRRLIEFVTATAELMYAVILKAQLGVGAKSEVRVKTEGLALQFGQFGVSVAVVVVALACARVCP